MLLCTQHHQLVHEGGFRIEKGYSGHWFFTRPDGRAVPSCGYRAVDMTDDDVETGLGDLQCHASAELRPSAEGFSVRRPPAEVSAVREPPAERYRAGSPSAEGWRDGISAVAA